MVPISPAKAAGFSWGATVLWVAGVSLGSPGPGSRAGRFRRGRGVMLFCCAHIFFLWAWAGSWPQSYGPDAVVLSPTEVSFLPAAWNTRNNGSAAPEGEGTRSGKRCCGVLRTVAAANDDPLCYAIKGVVHAPCTPQHCGMGRSKDAANFNNY
jgi:hypothetical protein